ncbi:DUF4190 domain-containing protein [Longispora sp. NPDC051575]|uniref:DUF4190 domain-containing protein n=1 Tax=Longispora sp. NPDC051575 TaxID=3154943 RepID=UPI003437AC0A
MTQPAGKDNTQLFGILGIVFAFCCSPVGVIFGFLSINQAKKTGGSQTLGQVAIGLSAVLFVLSLVYNFVIR